jgi:hypothetical protein
MNNSATSTCAYTLFSGGDSQFLRSVSIPLAEVLGQDLANDESTRFTDDRPDFLNTSSRPGADATILIGGIVGVFAFFSSWLASKILDDIYETKFQPAIRKVLGAADAKLKGANAKKAKMFLMGISYADKEVFILIGIVGDTFAEILGWEHMIETVHGIAVRWIDSNSSDQPIHLYIVDRGKVNIEPILFDNLISAHGYIQYVDRMTS